MPGTVPNGSSNRIWVGVGGAPPTVPLDYLQGYDYGSDAETTDEEFYMDDAPITTVGDPVHSGNVSGKYATGGPALAILRAAARTQDEITYGIAPGGTDGEYFTGRVNSFRLSGGGRRTALGYTFSIRQSQEPANIAAGL